MRPVGVLTFVASLLDGGVRSIASFPVRDLGGLVGSFHVHV